MAIVTMNIRSILNYRTTQNEAYGLAIISIIMPTGLQMQGGFTDEYDHVVSQTVSAKISGKCHATLPIEVKDATKMARERKNEFGMR